MVIKQPKVLAIGIDRMVFERLAPVLRRDAIEADWIPTIEAGLVLITNQPFDIILLAAQPFGESLGDLLRVIRGAGSASSGAAVMILAKPAEVDAARVFEGRGVNQVMLVSDPPERIRELMSKFFEVAPRASLHLPLRLEASIGEKGQELFCQTENLSRSGMLVKTRHQPELGSTVTFKIHLSDRAGTIFGRGEMVRHATPAGGGIDGLGIRFLSFSGDGARKLQNHLAGYVTEQEPSPTKRLESRGERRRGSRHDVTHKVALKFE